MILLWCNLTAGRPHLTLSHRSCTDNWSPARHQTPGSDHLIDIYRERDSSAPHPANILENRCVDLDNRQKRNLVIIYVKKKTRTVNVYHEFKRIRSLDLVSITTFEVSKIDLRIQFQVLCSSFWKCSWCWFNFQYDERKKYRKNWTQFTCLCSYLSIIFRTWRQHIWR